MKLRRAAQMTRSDSATYWSDRERYWNGLHAEHKGAFQAVGYSGLGEGFNRKAYERLRIPAVRRLLRRQMVPVKRVLEAGCGTAAYAPLWDELSVGDWVGVDISATAVEELKGRFARGKFFVLDLANPDVEISKKVGDAFSLVTAIDVLYHIAEDKSFVSALTWLAERVGQGGSLLVSDVFTDSHWGRRFAHVRRRPMAQYEDVLVPLGFHLVDREPVFGILGDPVPREGFHPVDQLLFQTWRGIQKSLRLMPARVRDAAGAWLVGLLARLDDLIRYTGCTAGVNLELALFARASVPARGPQQYP